MRTWTRAEWEAVKLCIIAAPTVVAGIAAYERNARRKVHVGTLAKAFAQYGWGKPSQWAGKGLPMADRCRALTEETERLGGYDLENSTPEVENSRTDQHCGEPETPCVPSTVPDNVDPEHWEPLKQWASPEQHKAVESLLRFGSVAAAADALDITGRQLRLTLTELERQAARRGWSPPHDMRKTVPDGFHVKGVSTLYDGDGNVRGQWVKTKIDQEHRIQQLLDAIQHIAEPFKGKSDLVPEPKTTNADLMTVYPLGDPHVGMFAWAEETGNDFDLNIAEAHLVEAVDKLVGLAPPSETALILDLGDFFHADNFENRTARSGHALDVDTRMSKVFRVGIRIMRRCIDRALEKHKTVMVWCMKGNHDDMSAMMLALCLDQFYENNPRVKVETSPSYFHYLRFGNCLIASTHGDNVKPAQLPGIMAVDRREDWGQTEHRLWYLGHVHHDSAKEYPGCMVETSRTLAAKDSWHAKSGYRSGRDLKADVWHVKHGRILRHVVGVEQLTGSAA